MLLSRFWYVFLGLVLGVALFVLYLAMSMYNRAGARSLGEALSSDSQVVAWYLKDDARQRSAQLIKFALNEDIAKYLGKSNDSESKVPGESRDKVGAALRAVNGRIDKEFSFDAVFAVDQHGRVVAHTGYEQASGMEDFELGGYPVVADALHGYIRDDTLVLDRIYRVVARPVELDLGQQPAGAIIGARIIDDRFARELSERTGAAVAFYTKATGAASAAPEGFDKSRLDQIVADLGQLDSDKDYGEIGRSSVRTIGGLLSVQYTRLPGEAWELGAGYAVGRLPQHVDSPVGFFNKADDKDKEQANVLLAVLVALLAAALGIGFSVLEHTRPLNVFRVEAAKLAKGDTDQLQPSKFRGVFRAIASDVNDGIEKVAAKGGVPRRAADLKQVLGDIPDQPQMSAFSFPGETASSPQASPPSQPKPMPSAPSNPRMPRPPPAPSRSATPAPAAAENDAGPARRPPPARPASPSPPAAQASSGNGALDEGEEWRKVYQDFVALKQQCGENVDGFTYAKFEQTLKKNKEALMKRHNARGVRFSVYVKEGKAALKASPIKE